MNHLYQRTLNIKKVGHAGTLDPLASGVLAIAVGKATKTVKYIMDGEKKYEFNTYHSFVVQVSRRRDELKNFLLKNGINTAIHYPIPIHLQPASKKLNYKVGDFIIAEDQANKILTLPIHQNLNQKTIKRISDLINYFYTSL